MMEQQLQPQFDTMSQAQAQEPQAAAPASAPAAPAAPAAERELAYNEVRLSDGRIIEMRETVGSDEMVVAGQLGEVFEANGSGAVIFQNCLIARTIVKIDGSPIARLRNYEGVRDFLGQFRGRDYTKIKRLFDKLNGDEGNE